MYFDTLQQETISERIQAGFHSDTREGKEQIRNAKLRSFFADYELYRLSGTDDPGDLPEREHKLSVTETEWNQHIIRRKAMERAAYAQNPF